jgi:hypothetical protein
LSRNLSKEIKRKYPITFTCGYAVAHKERNVDGVYLKLAGIRSGFPLSMKYRIIIQMAAFNLFARIRYLHPFFDIWTLDIIPTFDNMVVEVIDSNNIAINNCSNVNKKLA